MAELLDPTKKDEEDEFDPAKDYAQKDYDDKFNGITSTPENQALADQAEAGAADGFRYSPDEGRRDLAAAEGSGGDSARLDDKERGLYKQGEKEPQTGLRGRIGAGFKGMSTLKKRALIAVSGLFGVGALVGLAFLLFMVISGFSTKHIAEVMNIANMSRLHLASYRRMSQYLAEESLNPADGTSNPHRLQGQRRTLFDRLARFDPNRALGNLRQNDLLHFGTETNERRSWARLGRTVTDERIGYMRIGDFERGTRIDIPERARLHPITSYREQRQMIQQLEQALEGVDGFKQSSRYVRTKTVNAILQASDIQLYRWLAGGRRIQTFKDAILSAYERTRTRSNRSSVMPGVNEGNSQLEETMRNGPDNPRAQSALYDEAVEEIVQGANTSNTARVRNFARSTTMAGLSMSLYCAGREYIGSIEQNAKDRVIQYKQAGGLAQSTNSQIESGDTTMNAVMAEAKRWEGFNSSQRYQHVVGNPQVANTSGLDMSESPVPSTDGDILYSFYRPLVTGGDAAVRAMPGGLLADVLPDGWVDSAKDELCERLNSTLGTVALALGENILLAVFTGGSGNTASQVGSAGVQRGFMQVVKNVLSKESFSGVAIRGFTTDVFAFVLFDQALKMVFNHGGNVAIDDSSKMYDKSDLGMKLIANDTCNAMGCKELTPAERAELDGVISERRTALLKKQSLWARLTNFSDPKSPASQLAIRLPAHPEALQEKSTALAQASFNPLSNLSNNFTALASTKLGPHTAQAYKTIDDYETIGIPSMGYAADELDRMLDEDFWPQPNARWVEDRLEADPNAFDDLHECFAQMIETATQECDEDLTTDRALHYRLYLMDGGMSHEGDYYDGLLGSLLDVQEVTDTPGSFAGGPSGPLPEDVVDISETAVTSGCGGIRVHTSIVSNIEALCTAATAAGLNLAGGGYRDNAGQIAARRRNCGTSDYAIYQMPSNQCSPPTAIPGRSRHERGLAIDFTCSGSTVRRGDPCFNWLVANAERFGLFNLPSESWHWSTDGK